MTRNSTTPAGAAEVSHRLSRAPAALRISAFAVSAVLLSACGADSSENGSTQSGGVGLRLPDETSHIHGVGADPDTGEVFVATHAGLFRIHAPENATGGDAVPEMVGPAIDLMGFSIAGSGRFVASGHPGPGTDLPDPVGLIESRDGGQRWEPLSLQGESDFHALATGEERVIGFDGRLRATEDGSTWEDLDSAIEPFSLAVSDDGETVLAAARQGLRRSTDGGSSFTAVPEAPALVLIDWVAGMDSVYGISVDGQVHRSEDGGATWAPTGTVEGEPEALHADADQLIVVADHRVSRSTDEGATFEAW
ncbi:F510_1955 family glycosylhydrolase [Allosalinactinospora lopnorensis]|uniref:F510_1955 family glycosylhydrolase n=1 Tax=Allosalinactinospora lopnorensis TaxID=1352348 RepID=UPI0012E140C2|nr:hypothetical protein [Allosalinactinospora lopnorensis]